MSFSIIEPWHHWRSMDFSPKEQYDAWNAALNESHLEWSLSKPSSTEFFGEIEMHNIGGIRLLNCKSGPCHGKRTKHEINHSDEAYFGLLLIYAGGEVVRCDDKDSYVDNSSCVL